VADKVQRRIIRFTDIGEHAEQVDKAFDAAIDIVANSAVGLGAVCYQVCVRELSESHYFLLLRENMNSGQLTPKALANFSPRVGAQRQPWDYNVNSLLNPARVRLLANAFSVLLLFLIGVPGLSLRSNRWAEISERLRRSYSKINLSHYRDKRMRIEDHDTNTIVHGIWHFSWRYTGIRVDAASSSVR